MAQENRLGNERAGVSPSSNVLSNPSTGSSTGVDPETHTMATGSGMHTGRDGGSSMAQSGGHVTDKAQDKAHQVADQARDKAGELANQAKSRVTGQLDTRKDQATESLDSISSAFRETSSNLRNRDQDSIASAIDTAAEQMDRFTGYLRDRSVNELLTEAERLARREPALFIGGAFVLGILGARFFKASSPERDYYGGSYGRYADDSYNSNRSYPGRTPSSYRGASTYGTAYGSPSYRRRTVDADYDEYDRPARSSVGQPRGWEVE